MWFRPTVCGISYGPYWSVVESLNTALKSKQSIRSLFTVRRNFYNLQDPPIEINSNPKISLSMDHFYETHLRHVIHPTVLLVNCQSIEQLLETKNPYPFSMRLIYGLWTSLRSVDPYVDRNLKFDQVQTNPTDTSHGPQKLLQFVSMSHRTRTQQHFSVKFSFPSSRILLKFIFQNVKNY